MQILRWKTIYFSLKNFKTSKELSFSLPKMTNRSQKRKAVEELAAVDQETTLSRNNQSEKPVAGTSKSPKARTENFWGNIFYP